MSIAIVTDSTSDLSNELTANKPIFIVPNLVVVQGESLLDGIEISRQEFYERMPFLSTPPTTATASAGTYQNLYQDLLQKGFQSIISIHVASQLSGVLNAASTAAKNFGDRVHVLDSQQVSLGLGFQVLAAAEAITQGASLERVVHIIEEVRKRIKVVAMFDTLEYIRRSGRVSWARAQIGNLLNIKPFLEIKNGRVLRMGEARTRRKGIERLGSFIQALGKLEKLAILHTNAESDAVQFLSNQKIQLPTPPMLVNVTTVIGVHVGPNALGFAAVVQ